MSQDRRFRLIVSIAACLGLAQFLVALSYAVAHYPGGYEYFGNFLSDLGRTHTPSGADNHVSSLVFNSAIVVLGLTLLPFFSLVPSTLQSGRSVSWVFALGGIFSSLGLIGIGLTPYDVFFIAHHVALAAWLAPMFLLAIIYLFLAFESDAATSGLIACTAALILAVLAYATVGFHSGYVAMQKVTAAFSIAWFLVLAFRIVFSTVTQVTTRRQQIERLAEQYLLRLQHGHRRSR